ncbi:hypothetical protein K1T71_012007 [Dendrolimus kikuchii]|uniref:Uncharacterized protein n=1 Tax=Dendrolimus kikuchii TaxID=765133 RepID=A0ACC1CKC1_9NEOP|nr:hypothetical protein K1T71_012007 [Dendrolimus kikuchii]
MLIQKVHGLHATNMSLNDRFTLLASAAPGRVAGRPIERKLGNFLANDRNYRNRDLIAQIAWRLEQQAERLALRQRLGYRQGRLRRFGSESNLPGLRKSNSFGNLSQMSVKDRVSWQPNGGLRRAASFGSLFGESWQGKPLRGFRRRGGGQRALRGRFGLRGRGGHQNRNRTKGATQQARGNPTALPTGRGRGFGRGGVLRNQTSKPVPTKEELDAELDQYMASTKWALDKELDAYMKNAMELE